MAIMPIAAHLIFRVRRCTPVAAAGLICFSQLLTNPAAGEQPTATQPAPASKPDPSLTNPASLPARWMPSAPPAPANPSSDQRVPADAPAVSREFRGVWVATVANVDWPSKRELTVAQQQDEITSILDNAARCNLNAIILQVRPTCDAIYPSTLEPWSEFVTGIQGRPPSPLYDPLLMWIEGAHRRGMELHAWFNPFRARHIKTVGPDAPSHVVNAKPGLVRKHNGYLWLDPGEQLAQDHSMAVIMDVVRRYDLDGVHFDDYFYPYPKDGEPFPDGAVYARYQHAGGKLELDAWRRDNIDRFMHRVYDEVKAVKPFVKVGISPFGIWRPESPAGIKGFDAFAKLHADSRKWLGEGWCDYLSPQLYWRRDAKEQGFEPLLRWWLAQNPKGRQIWPGIYTSRIGQTPAASATANGGAGGKPVYDSAEIVGQVELTRSVIDKLAATSTSPMVRPGVIHFSAVALLENREGIADKLRLGPYAKPALVPQTASVGTPPAAAPQASILAAPADLVSKPTVRWTPSPADASTPFGPTVVQLRTKAGAWTTRFAPAGTRSITVDVPKQEIDTILVQTSTREGLLSRPAVLR